MAENATSLALVRDSDGRVLTFVRLDVPEGWMPPEGFTAVPDDELPEGWERVPEELPPVPQTVSARQIRLWLVSHGISLSQIEAAIASIEDTAARQVVQIEWEYAPYVERTHPWLDSLGEALGLDAAAVDQAFREASTL